MKHITTGIGVLLLSGLMAAPAAAQVWGSRGGNQRIPPGQMPPAGMCRVWYDGVPPGQQPGPINCRDAERIASRSSNARVIYGNDGRYDDRYGYPDRNRDGRDDRYENRYPSSGGYGSNNGCGAGSVPYRNGYQDGLEKGREDANDRDPFDPVRHSRYRSADHGYNSRYGSKNDYKLVYRDGFEAGYRDGYNRNRTNRDNGSFRLPWPF
jgi:hypothetical protein